MPGLTRAGREGRARTARMWGARLRRGRKGVFGFLHRVENWRRASSHHFGGSRGPVEPDSGSIRDSLRAIARANDRRNAHFAGDYCAVT